MKIVHSIFKTIRERNWETETESERKHEFQKQNQIKLYTQFTMKKKTTHKILHQTKSDHQKAMEMFNWMKWEFKFFNGTIVLKANINMDEWIWWWWWFGGGVAVAVVWKKNIYNTFKIVNAKFRDSLVEVYTTTNN